MRGAGKGEVLTPIAEFDSVGLRYGTGGEVLRDMQTKLLERARAFRDANSFEVNSYDEFKKKIEEPGGFLWAHWDGTRATEDKIQAETKATIRCIPFNRTPEQQAPGKCMVTGQPSAGMVVFARAY